MVGGPTASPASKARPRPLARVSSYRDFDGVSSPSNKNESKANDTYRLFRLGPIITAVFKIQIRPYSLPLSPRSCSLNSGSSSVSGHEPGPSPSVSYPPDQANRCVCDRRAKSENVTSVSIHELLQGRRELTQAIHVSSLSKLTVARYMLQDA